MAALYPFPFTALEGGATFLTSNHNVEFLMNAHRKIFCVEHRSPPWRHSTPTEPPPPLSITCLPVARHCHGQFGLHQSSSRPDLDPNQGPKLDKLIQLSIRGKSKATVLLSEVQPILGLIGINPTISSPISVWNAARLAFNRRDEKRAQGPKGATRHPREFPANTF